jgi:folylpolyglutamate synthase/dihydropteroate synthase
MVKSGHNPAAGRNLAQTLIDLEERAPKPLYLEVGMMGLKDAAGFLSPFRALALSRSARARASGRRRAAGELNDFWRP